MQSALEHWGFVLPWGSWEQRSTPRVTSQNRTQQLADNTVSNPTTNNQNENQQTDSLYENNTKPILHEDDTCKSKAKFQNTIHQYTNKDTYQRINCLDKN